MCSFFCCFLFVLDVLLTFFWSLFDRYLMHVLSMMVSSSFLKFFLLMWYSICWCCLNVLLGRCCCFFDVSQTFLNSLWHHVTSFIGFTSSQHKHANPTSGGDQSYPLTLAANLAEPSYVHSGVFRKHHLQKWYNEPWNKQKSWSIMTNTSWTNLHLF